MVTGLLAESWENPDPLTYRYTIHDNVFFHDKPPVNGRQLTADDVAANYERLHGIGRFAGQEPAAHTWGTKAIPIESVTAIDNLTFEIKLSQPYADTARQLFDDCHIRAYPPEIFDMLHDANSVIGTGPFIMDEFVSATSITFDKNPNYWRDDEKFPGNRLPYVDRLVFLMMSDEATRVAALRSRQIDITGDLGDVRHQVDQHGGGSAGTPPGDAVLADFVPVRDVVGVQDGGSRPVERRQGAARDADGDRH